MLMNPETEITAWTVDTLKEYFEARLYANETAIEAAKTGADAAITAAKESTEIADWMTSIIHEHWHYKSGQA